MYYPIHKNQLGLQVGKGAEGALSGTFDYFERFVLRRGYCLVLFLDISPAYDRHCAHQEFALCSWWRD